MKLKHNSSGFQSSQPKKKRKRTDKYISSSQPITSHRTSKRKISSKSSHLKKLNKVGNNTISIPSNTQSSQPRRVYRRGPICGVDNCPSNLYFSLNGQRTCQYGHIMHNDFEFEDDAVPESGGGGQIRRLKLGLDSRGNFTSNEALKRGYAKVMAKRRREREILYGEEGKQLYFSICQQILEWQVYRIGLLLELDDVQKEIYQDLIFKIWYMYLKKMMSSKGKKMNLLKLDLVTLLCFHYLVLCVLMKLEIFLNDFIKMIECFELPHLNCLKLIPLDLKLNKLPNFFIKRISGKQVFPENNVLVFYKRLSFVVTELNFSSALSKSKDMNFNTDFPWKQFLIKMIKYLNLDIFHNQKTNLQKIIINLIETTDSFKKKVTILPKMKKAGNNTITNYNELTILGLICLTVKTLINIEYRKSIEKDDIASKNFDDGAKIFVSKNVNQWIAWYKTNENRLKSNRLINEDYWDVKTINDDEASDIDDYLDYVQERVMPQFSVEQKAKKPKKLQKKNSKMIQVTGMFPLKEIDQGNEYSVFNLQYDQEEAKKSEINFQELISVYEGIKSLMINSFKMKPQKALIDDSHHQYINLLDRIETVLQLNTDIYNRL
ncbi:hypothetical protein FOG48_01788 [Hanseniaspora uvarum]|nr:hypothetical protein FOG48_01788 [Hanseniaspora uvarum]GMM40072.1 Rrn7 protein [Hanseniaspora uvarum]